jgi:hypothetical protein
LFAIASALLSFRALSVLSLASLALGGIPLTSLAITARGLVGAAALLGLPFTTFAISFTLSFSVSIAHITLASVLLGLLSTRRGDLVASQHRSRDAFVPVTMPTRPSMSAFVRIRREVRALIGAALDGRDLARLMMMMVRLMSSRSIRLVVVIIARDSLPPTFAWFGHTVSM